MILQFCDSVLSKLSKNIVKPEQQIVQKEESIQPLKKEKTKIRHRYKTGKMSNIAKELRYDPKHQEQEEASFTVEVLCLIISKYNFGAQWRREYIYKLAMDVLFDVRLLEDGTLYYLDPNSVYRNKTYTQLCRKIDRAIDRLMKKGYIETFEHNDKNDTYAKDFVLLTLNFQTNTASLKKYATDSRSGKKQLSHRFFLKKFNYLTNGEPLIEDDSINFFTKVKDFYNNIFNFSKRTKQSSYYNYYKQVHQQQRQITSDLNSTISDTGKFQCKVGRGKGVMKTLTYVDIKTTINSKGQIKHIITGRGKDVKELYKEMCRAVKQMTYDKSKKALNDLLNYIKGKSNEIKDILSKISRDTFFAEDKPIILKPKNIDPGILRKEEFILKRIKDMEIPVMHEQVVFNHDNKTCKISTKAMDMKIIKSAVETAKWRFPERFKIRLTKDSTYTFAS